MIIRSTHIEMAIYNPCLLELVVRQTPKYACVLNTNINAPNRPPTKRYETKPNQSMPSLNYFKYFRK